MMMMISRLDLLAYEMSLHNGQAKLICWYHGSHTHQRCRQVNIVEEPARVVYRDRTGALVKYHFVCSKKV